MSLTGILSPPFFLSLYLFVSLDQETSALMLAGKVENDGKQHAFATRFR